jgi:AcrR family transcriptional regulator
MVARQKPRPTGAPAPSPWLVEDLAGVTDPRERLIRAAWKLFWRHGTTSVGVDRIVAEADVAKTSLYRYFGSKEGLVVAVVERHSDVFVHGWLAPEIEQRADTPREQLLAIFDAFADWFAQEPFEGCLFINLVAESHHEPGPIRTASVAAIEAVRELIRELLEAAGARDPDDLAHRFQLLMMGSIIGALNHYRDAARHARASAELLLEQELGPAVSTG